MGAIGAFDLMSKNVMLQRLGNIPDGVRVLRFVRLFSTHVWEDELGDPQLIPQGKAANMGTQ